MLPADAVLSRAEADFDASVQRLSELLRIPSVSTDPAYRDETRRAGQWLADQLTGLWFTASLRETPGHPVVVAHHPGPEDGSRVPHLLYYGHYDVQPPDQLELWQSQPFDPVIVGAERGPRIVARSAVDDKEQVMTWIEAFRAWRAVHGTLPVRVSVILEGEEETGSPSLPRFLEDNAAELKADAAIVTDTNSWDIATPAITTSLRGLLYMEVRLHGPSRDLHSGMFGGAVVNPINALTRIVGQIHDEAGRVQFPGFYDGIPDLDPALRGQWAGLDFDEGAFLGEIGLKTPHGEAGYYTLEGIWARPTCNLNGIYGGCTGEESKTVIAAHATAKLSCRLVPGQDPERVRAGIIRFSEERTTPDCRLEFQTFGSSPWISVATDSPWLQAAHRGLKRIYGCDAVLMGCGGSIPVVGWINDVMDMESVLVGFGLDDYRIHSPNEKFELRCYRNGILGHAAILAELAGRG